MKTSLFLKKLYAWWSLVSGFSHYSWSYTCTHSQSFNGEILALYSRQKSLVPCWTHALNLGCGTPIGNGSFLEQVHMSNKHSQIKYHKSHAKWLLGRSLRSLSHMSISTFLLQCFVRPCLKMYSCDRYRGYTYVHRYIKALTSFRLKRRHGRHCSFKCLVSVPATPS